MAEKPGFVREMLDSFWSPKIWLYNNVKWDDLELSVNPRYAEFDLVYYPFLAAVLCMLLRKFLERTVFNPLGKYFGLHVRTRKPIPNATLEAAYKASPKMNKDKVAALAKRTDWDVRRVERWLRLRTKQDRPSVLDKFCECGWRCSFYTVLFCYGLYYVWDKHWFWDLQHCWKGHPNHGVDTWAWFYYQCELGFYWSLFATQFFDHKRKDWWQMFIHHIATLSLISFSWVINHFRIGAVILVVHDAADIFLEGAKMAHYARLAQFSMVLLCLFVVVWFYSRLYILPVYIVHTVRYDMRAFLGPSPAYTFLEVCLWTLQILHVIWTYFILKIVIESIFTKGKPKGDTRSDTSDNVSPEEDDDVSVGPVKNNAS